MKITKTQLKKIILEEFAGLTGIEFNTDPKEWPTPESYEEAEDLAKWGVGGIVQAELDARSLGGRLAGKLKGMRKGNYPGIGLDREEVKRLEADIYDELVAMAHANAEADNAKARAEYDREQAAKKAVQDVDLEYAVRKQRKQAEYRKELDDKAKTNRSAQDYERLRHHGPYDKEEMERIKSAYPNVFKEADYATHAAERGVYMDPPQSLRFGKGVASSKSSTEGDNFPHWSSISKALNIIFEELSVLHNSSKTFQQDRGLLGLIFMIRDFLNKHAKMQLKEVEYRYTEDMWKSTMNLAEYILEKVPDNIEIYQPQIFDKIMRLAEFIRQVSAARWGSMSVGYSLQGQEEDLIIPQELR